MKCGGGCGDGCDGGGGWGLGREKFLSSGCSLLRFVYEVAKCRDMSGDNHPNPGGQSALRGALGLFVRSYRACCVACAAVCARRIYIYIVGGAGASGGAVACAFACASWDAGAVAARAWRVHDVCMARARRVRGVCAACVRLVRGVCGGVCVVCAVACAWRVRVVL